MKNEAAVALGKLAHSRQSQAQSESSRRNGKAGGRPRLLANEQHDGSESNAPTCSALDLAIRFHETYERLAPNYGYETRLDTRAFDPTSKNGKVRRSDDAATQGGKR